MESVEYKHVNFVSWDVGGRDKIVSTLFYGLKYVCMCVYI